MLDCTVNFFYTQYMFSLSDASKTTKEIIKWAGLILALIVVLFMLWKVLFFAKDLFFPKPPPKPTVAFDKLPLPSFPQNVTSLKLNYSLNTLTGQLPSLPNIARVYRIQPIQPDLLALSKFNGQVGSIGFSLGYTALSDKVFEWKNNNNLSNLDRRLRFNIVNYSFTIVSPYTSDEGILSAKNLPTQKDARRIAQNTLENIQKLPSDLDLSKTKVNLFSIKNGGLFPATSISNTQIIEVAFVQNDLDKLPIFYENPNSSNIRVLIAGGDFQGQVVGADYSYQKISNDFSTYPIKTSAEAYNDLKQGNGYISSYDGSSSNVLINNVFLAYYMGNQPQDFILPIYVFQGNDNFYAYVSAVKDEWINK